MYGKIKQFLCGLFVGHRFRSIDTQVCHNPINRTYTIIETCCKCGKVFSFTANEENFYD